MGDAYTHRGKSNRNTFRLILSGDGYIKQYGSVMYCTSINRIFVQCFYLIFPHIISCYRPLGPYDFGFFKKSLKKISCLCTFKFAMW
jgi:hypothetical protein